MFSSAGGETRAKKQSKTKNLGTWLESRKETKNFFEGFTFHLCWGLQMDETLCL